jgi:hypothetical protein
MVASASTSARRPRRCAWPALGDRRLADAGIADIERVVLRAAAQHLDGAVDLGLAADQRIDLAGFRLLVEVDAVGGERVLLLLLAAFLASARRWPDRLLVVGAARRCALRAPGRLAMPWLM